MKKYSNTRFFLEYISILFVTYLILSGIVALIGNCPYKEVLYSPGQIYILMLFYWWVPIFRMVDMEKHNRNCPEKF